MVCTNLKLRIAGMVDDSIVDGDGLRLTIFTQGCPHHCHGCQNPETHDYNGGYEIELSQIIAKLADNPLLSGVTFSGGEPFLQPAPLYQLAKAIHRRGLDIWAYTGFTLEELATNKNQAITALLQEIDVLVDGPYQEAKRDLTLNFRGSSNQRIIDLNTWRKTGQIKLLYND